MAQVTIETIKNGPYIVIGEVELIDADGNKYPVEKRMALCRCGASTEKPFCDGTHSKIGFQAAEKAVPESKERRCCDPHLSLEDECSSSPFAPRLSLVRLLAPSCRRR